MYAGWRRRDGITNRACGPLKTNAITKLIVFRVGGSKRSQHLLGADRAESMDHNWPQGRGIAWRIEGWAGVLFGMRGMCVDRGVRWHDMSSNWHVYLLSM